MYTENFKMIVQYPGKIHIFMFRIVEIGTLYANYLLCRFPNKRYLKIDDRLGSIVWVGPSCSEGQIDW